MNDWIGVRRRQLKQSLLALRQKKNWTVVQPYSPFEGSISKAQIIYADETIFKRLPDFECDIFLGQGNAPDRAKLIYVRETGRAKLLASWFWDNHHQCAETSQVASLTDVYFSGHFYKSSYIENYLSINGGFIPMFPVPWTLSEVEETATMALLAPRSDRLYGGYNSYPQFANRDAIIAEVKATIADANIFLTPVGTPLEKHPFNSKTTQQRLLEYMSHKVVFCIPVDQDLTCRMFDALLAGCIPLLVGRPPDLDLVFSRDLQALLPIIVSEDASPSSVRSGYDKCLAQFDLKGVDGVMFRHVYAKDNHMPEHRLKQIIKSIENIVENFEQLDQFALNEDV